MTVYQPHPPDLSLERRWGKSTIGGLERAKPLSDFPKETQKEAEFLYPTGVKEGRSPSYKILPLPLDKGKGTKVIGLINTLYLD